MLGGRRAVSRGFAHVIGRNVLDVVQRDLLAQHHGIALTARVGKLSTPFGLTQLQLKGLAQHIGEPPALGQVLIIIANVEGVLGSNCRVHAIHLREVNTPRLGQGNRGQGTHISGRVRTLELGLHVRGHLVRLGQAESPIVAAHPLEGAQNHRGLAVDRQDIALDLDAIGAYDAIQLLRELHSILPEVGDALCLEQQLQRREEGLRILQVPGTHIDFGYPGTLQRHGRGSKILSHCVPPEANQNGT